MKTLCFFLFLCFVLFFKSLTAFFEHFTSWPGTERTILKTHRIFHPCYFSCLFIHIHIVFSYLVQSFDITSCNSYTTCSSGQISLLCFIDSKMVKSRNTFIEATGWQWNPCFLLLSWYYCINIEVLPLLHYSSLHSWADFCKSFQLLTASVDGCMSDV